MTQQTDVPLTRRELRRREAAAATTPVLVGPAPRRRDLREVPTQRTAAADAAPRVGPAVPPGPQAATTWLPAGPVDGPVPVQPATAWLPAGPVGPPVDRPLPDVATTTAPVTRRDLHRRDLRRGDARQRGDVQRGDVRQRGVERADRDRRPGPSRRDVQRRSSGTAGSLVARSAKPVTLVALSATLVLTGLQLDVAPDRARTAAAVQEALAREAAAVAAERVRRADVATATRLTAQATAYAATQRAEALAVAQEALAQADAVAAQATTVLEPDALTPLDSAVSELQDLLERTPAPLTAPVVHQAAATPRTTGTSVPVGPEVTTTEAGGSGAGGSSAAGPGDPTAAPGPDVATALVAATPVPKGAAARTVTTAADDATTAPGSPTEGDAGSSGVPATAPDDPAAVLRTPAASRSASRDTPVRPLLAPVAAPVALVEGARAMDLGVTDRLLAAAEALAALSQEVRSSAEARVAEEQARAAAEAAAAQAAAEQARRVEAAEEAGNGRIPASVLCSPASAPGALLRCDAAEAFDALDAAYRAAFGHGLRVSSSYRSLDAQVAVRASRGSLAATPGTSNHGWGVAVDLDGFGGVGDFSSASYRWMRENAGRYGWYHPSYMQAGGSGPHEPWHWQFGEPE